MRVTPLKLCMYVTDGMLHIPWIFQLPRLMQPRRKAEKTHSTTSRKEPTKRDTFTAITRDTLYSPQ